LYVIFFGEFRFIHWNKLNRESNNLENIQKIFPKKQNSLSNFPKKRFKIPRKKRHTTFIQPLQCLGVKVEMLKNFENLSPDAT